MNIEITQNQAGIQETARKFAQEELLPGVLERDANSEFPVEQFHKMGELGLVGLPYPKEVGGQGADYLSYVLAVEEISAVVKTYEVVDELKEIDLKLGDLTAAERQIILDGCLINYYRATK